MNSRDVMWHCHQMSVSQVRRVTSLGRVQKIAVTATNEAKKCKSGSFEEEHTIAEQFSSTQSVRMAS